jgi:hypothetical protein
MMADVEREEEEPRCSEELDGRVVLIRSRGLGSVSMSSRVVDTIGGYD